MNGYAWNGGGGNWLAVVRRADGGVVAISDEVVCEYASEDGLLCGQAGNSIPLMAGAAVG